MDAVEACDARPYHPGIAASFAAFALSPSAAASVHFGHSPPVFPNAAYKDGSSSSSSRSSSHAAAYVARHVSADADTPVGLCAVGMTQ